MDPPCDHRKSARARHHRDARGQHPRGGTASDQSITFTGHGYEYDLGGGPLGTSSFARPTPFVARHTSSGMHVWSRAFDRNLDVSGFSPMLLLAQQPGGSVVVGSDFISPIVLDGSTYTPRGSADLLYFQLKP